MCIGINWKTAWAVCACVFFFVLLPGCEEEGNDGSEIAAPEHTFNSLRTKLNEYNWVTDPFPNFTIVDIRSAEEWGEGCIQGAINIPYDTFLGDEGELIDGGEALISILTDQGWDIVIYGGDLTEIKQFVLAAEELGYSQLSYYPGGVSEWKEHNEYLVISYEAFREWYDAYCPFDDGENYLIDVNEEEDYTGERKGGHVPAATLVDNRKFVKIDGSKEMIDDAKVLSDALPNKDAKIVIYCSDSWCPISGWASEVAVALGYTDVYRFEGGWIEWEEQGNELALGLEPGPCAEPETAP